MGKRRHDESEENQEAETAVSEGAKRRKDAKKRKGLEEPVVKDDSQDNAVLDRTPGADAKKTKRKKKEDLRPEHPHSAESEDATRKAAKRSKKDRKHSEADANTVPVPPDETAEADTSQIPAQDKVKKKKKSKHKVASDGQRDDFPDPLEDEGLSERARAALHYTYLHKTNPKEWKFNKGLQNWIVKNLWSEEAIPSKYFILIQEYLSGSQGAVRTNIIETCKKMSSTTSVNDKPDEVVEEKMAVAVQRSRQLLTVLGDGES